MMSLKPFFCVNQLSRYQVRNSIYANIEASFLLYMYQPLCHATVQFFLLDMLPFEYEPSVFCIHALL
jgi:hypothetical protein